MTFKNIWPKTLLSALFVAAGSVFFPATASDTVEVFTYDAGRRESTVTVPVNPKRIAVIDYASLDIIDALGVGDRIVGLAKGSCPDYLASYVQNDAIENIGTVKEVSLERLMAAEPEVIFIGGRLATQYDELSRIAPVVQLGVDYEFGLVNSVKRNIDAVAAIFDLKDHAFSKLQSLDERLEKVSQEASGKVAVIGLATAGSFKTLGNNGRCAFITREGGFTNAAPDINANHGNESSFELIFELNPEYIFVLDRDSAIGVKGPNLAEDLMANELIAKTKASIDNHIYYLDAAVWYLSEGGLTALDRMILDLEKALDLKN